MRMAIIIDGNGQAAVGAFDATTGAMTRMSSAADVVNRAVGKAGSGIEDAGKKAESAGRRADDSSKRWERMGRTIGLQVAAVVAAIGVMGVKALNEADKIDNLSQRLSISTEALSGYGYAAKRSGADLDVLTGGVGRFNQVVAKAVDRGSREGKLFAALGLDAIDKTTGKLQSFEKLLPSIADKFKAINDPALKSALAVRLFGSNGEELTRMLNSGSSGLAQYEERLRALGGVVTPEAASAASAFKDQLGDLQIVTLGIARDIETALLPKMTETVGKLVDLQQDGEFAANAVTLISTAMSAGVGVIEIYNHAVSKLSSDIELVVNSSKGLATTVSVLGVQGLASGANPLERLKIAKAGIDQMRAADKEHARQMALLNAPATKAPVAVTFSDSGNAPDSMFKMSAGELAAHQQAKDLEARLRGQLADPTGRNARDTERRQREAERLQDQLRKSAAEAAIAAAALNGPYAEAVEKAHQKELDWAADVDKGRMTRAAFNQAVTASKVALEELRIEVEKQQQAPDRLLADMRAEITTLSQLGRQREIHRRQLQAEADMRREIADAQEAGRKFSQEEIASLIQEAHALAELSVATEESAQRAEDWANVWISGANSAADAFTDFTMSSFSKFEQFESDIKNVAKRLIGDLIRTFLQQKIIIPIQTQITSSFSGQGGSGGGLLDGILSLFKGNGFGAAGQSGNGFSGMVGNVGSFFSKMFGGGAAASSAASTGTTAWGAFGPGAAGWIGTGSSAATGASAAGGLAGAMGSVASFMPYAALIMAGMKMAGKAYGEGFGLKYQDKGDMLLRGNLMSGGLATPLMLDSMSLDKLGKMLGMSDKTAAIFSGSSLLGKVFGRAAPKVTGQGITGTYGFEGITGQNFADWKAKGGWFRSDKKGTNYSSLSSEVDQFFDAAAQSVKRGALQLAEQAGMDINAQLAKVKVSLGKVTLDADPEKAKAQLEKMAVDMVEKLSGETIKALGFSRLLDDGFKATEIMGGLSAAMALVTGETGKLNRSLTGLEIENVQRAVEYFEGLAKGNGTTLTDEIQRVTGTLNDYAGLMTDVQTKLLTGGLSDAQRAALEIETTYRSQIKSVNEWAKSLGLAGARTEDLAKIEQLRAVSMASLQKQMEAQRNDILAGLSLSEYSPLTDTQKLAESLQQLREAAARGDTSAAASLANTASEFNRRVNASGNDYNSVYEQITGIIQGMGVPSLVTDDGTGMGDLADILLDLPQQIASAMFEKLYNPATASTTNPTLPATSGDPESRDILREIRDGIRDLVGDGRLNYKTAGLRALEKQAGLM